LDAACRAVPGTPSNTPASTTQAAAEAQFPMYRGGAGQWAWLLHRLTGVAVLLFLLLHILDTALVLFGPELYDKIVKIYTNPVFRVGEVGLAAAVLFHALNGIRITLLDFYPEWGDRQRELFYGVVALFVVIFLPGAYIMLKALF
jgi:succinate dehydrogenase / fumarate reductase cytochrome b subunit